MVVALGALGQGGVGGRDLLRLAALKPLDGLLAELTNRKLRRSAHRSITELEADIRQWINELNKEPRPFVWTEPADDTLETIAEYCHRVNAPGTR